MYPASLLHTRPPIGRTSVSRLLGRGAAISCLAAIALAASLALLSPASRAGPADHTEAVRRIVETHVRPWIDAPIMIDALRHQNAANSSLMPTEIQDLDTEWRRQTLSTERPLIRSVMSTELSQYLRDFQFEHRGLFTEIFVIDNRGLNVGQSAVTSDYWQGDEDKWQRTFLVGPDAIFIDDVEEDESTQQFQSQVSLSIADPLTGQAIGSITLGVDVDRALDLLP